MKTKNRTSIWQFLLTLALLVSAFSFQPSAFGQVSTNALTTIDTNAPATWGQVGHDLWGIIGGVTPDANSLYRVDIGGGQNTASGHWEEFAALSLANTNGTAIGVLGGHVGNTWLYGGGTIGWGRTDNLPFVGKVREMVGDGPIWDFKTHEVANYSFTGLEKDWDINGKIHLGASGIVANRSNAGGVDILGAVHCTWSF